MIIAGLAAFLGHCFPVWLGFKGGKGVAAFIGVLLGLAWPVGLIFCAVWLVIALARKMSSLAALTAAVTSPIFAYVIGLYDPAFDSIKLAATTAIMALILVYTHRANIGRLLNGTEPKIGSEKKRRADEMASGGHKADAVAAGRLAAPHPHRECRPGDLPPIAQPHRLGRSGTRRAACPVAPEWRHRRASSPDRRS